jgi:CheY-like chemotaxis protein
MILYVDDDKDDQEIFQEVISLINPEVICLFANDGVEALTLLNGSISPRMVFLDVNMPVMNGIQVLRQLKQNLAHKDLSVIMYSTSKTVHTVTECLALGAEGFVEKPASINEAVQRLKPWIDKM